MGLISRDQILKADDLKTKTVPVPEWGGEIILRSLTGMERDEFETSLFVDGKFANKNLRARLLVRCIVDEKGQRIFSNEDSGDLGQRNGAVLDRLYDIANELSGIGKKALDDATKNSTPDQS
jgi:hypothetical protein